MRTLMVIAEMGSGGAEAVVEELVRGAVAAGDDVVVASSGGRREAAVREAGGRTARVPLAGRTPVGLLRAQRALHRVGRTERPALVHAHNVGATLNSHLGLRHLRRRPPLLTTFHGVADEDYQRSARVLARCSDHVVAVHAEVADRLRAAGLRGVPLSVVTNAVSAPAPVDRTTARAALGLEAHDVVALCAARLVPQKRHDVLVDAWSRLPGKAVLLLAGPGELRDAVAADVRARGLQARVRLLGERSDVPVLMAAADLFVLSSDWEGLPIALLEALAAGLPIVATAVDGVVEAAGEHAASLVPPGDPAALAAALALVVADADTRANMSAAARSRASERGSAVAMVEQYQALYASLLPPRGSDRTVGR